MNTERIRELAIEAGLWRQHYDIGEESSERLEKFALLIVKECIDIVPWQYESKIREHFGIENEY
jgi:hypothetical protein